MSEQSNTPPLSTTSRWWEYYAVRYAMGIGTGTPLIYLLLHRYRDAFAPQIKITDPFESTVAAVLWAAIGLTFCYVASLPMLTIHTARIFMKRKWWDRNKLIGLTGTLVLPSLSVYFLFSKWVDCNDVTQKIALILPCLLVSFQGFLIVCVLISPQKTLRLYGQLETRRPLHPDLVESYRHMREHGNSVLIVLGELLLTYCLWEIHPNRPTESSALSRLGVVFALWLIPSGFVWFVGTKLELYLSGQRLTAQTAHPFRRARTDGGPLQSRAIRKMVHYRKR